MSGSEPDRFNRRSWGRSLNSRKSADFITATHGGQPEESFSEGSAVFSDLESTAIRRDSGPVGSGLFPCWHCYQTWSPRLFCYLLDPGGPPVNKPRKVNKLVREPKASTKGDPHFPGILAGQSGRWFVGLAVNFERVRSSGREQVESSTAPAGDAGGNPKCHCPLLHLATHAASRS